MPECKSAWSGMMACVQIAAYGTTVMMSLPAIAQQQPVAKRFAVPAGPLADTLATFAEQSGYDLAYDPALAASGRSPGVTGIMTPIAALSRLLDGSGLSYRIAGGRIVLERAPASGKALVLGTLRVGDAIDGGGTAVGPSSTRRETPPADMPYVAARSTAYIPRETIERFRGETVADIVKGVAGVTAADPRVANALDVNIRGIQGQGRVPIIIDGAQAMVDTYRGYAGQSQRTYLDPDLIGGITIDKGPSLATNASGAIGGVVSMTTLEVGDILRDGKNIGLRVRAGTSDGSVRGLPAYSAVQRSRDTLSPGGYFGNIVLARRLTDVDILIAYARRQTGNYFAGSNGYGDYPEERRTVATLNPANAEVFNTSNRSDSVLLKAAWRIDDTQALEGSYRRYDGRSGEIMASQIVRGNGERVPQWEPGRTGMDAYTLTYRARPEGNLADFTARLWYTRLDSLAYNGLTGITPWYFDRRTEWYDGPTFNTEAGYRDAYRNDLTSKRFGGDITNITRIDSGVGNFVLTYGAAFSDEDVRPGERSPIKQDDLINNRFLRNAERREYSVTGSLLWKPVPRLELLVGARANRVDIHDRNRLATITREEAIGRYRYTSLLNGNPAQPSRATRAALVNWYPDANGTFTQASLLASPYKKGTVADLPGWNFYTATAPQPYVVPVAWRWSEPIRVRDTAFMPTASIAYDAGFARAYFRYAEGVKLPSLFETTLGLFTAARPTNGLKPERSRNWEAGISTLRRGTFVAGDRLGARLAYFDNRIDDFITRDYRTLSAGLIRNVDRFKVSGIEVQAEYAGRVPFLELSAHYYMRAKTCAPDIAAERRAYGVARKIPALAATPDCTDGGYEGAYTNTQNPPRFNLNATLGARLFDDRLTLGARAIHNSGPISKLDKDWNEGLSAIQQLYRRSMVVDLFASAVVTPSLTVDANVDNVGDRYYLDPLALGVMPAPGRTFRLAISYRY